MAENNSSPSLHSIPEQLQNVIDKLELSLYDEWTSPLPFPIERIVGPNDNVIGGSLMVVNPDILQYLAPSFSGCRMYFSKHDYNPANGFKSSDRSPNTATDWDRLRTDLCRATYQYGGFHLISNGYSKGGKSKSRKLVCKQSRRYIKSTKHDGPGHEAEGVDCYRESSFVNDRKKNSRGVEGLKNG